MKALSPSLRGAAVCAAAMISLSAGTAISQVATQAPAPPPPPEGQTVIVLPPGAPPPAAVEPIPVPPPEPKKKGFFGRLFGGSDDKNKRQDKEDNDDDGDTKRPPKAEIVIEEASPSGQTQTLKPMPPQGEIAVQPAPDATLRPEPTRKTTRRSSEIQPSPKTRGELPAPSGVVTETLSPPTAPPTVRTAPTTTEIQRVPASSTTSRTSVREVPGQAAVTASSTATAPLPADQPTLEQARAKTEMNKILTPPDTEVTQQQTPTDVIPSQRVMVKPPGQTTVKVTPNQATTEQQKVLAETKNELARLKGEVATVKEELESTKRTSTVDLNKVTISAPNEATPITPPEPPDAAASPTRAASVAGSEAPTDKMVVKPSEPPGGLTSPPPAPASSSDTVTIGTSAAKESGTTTATSGSKEGTPESDSSNGVPTGTKTDSPDFVRSPFPPHTKLDVKGMRPGSLAKDPTNGKVFRVP